MQKETGEWRMNDELDDFQSRKPIDVISSNRPILILDEPQKMEGKKTLDLEKDTFSKPPVAASGDPFPARPRRTAGRGSDPLPHGYGAHSKNKKEGTARA